MAAGGVRRGPAIQSQHGATEAAGEVQLASGLSHFQENVQAVGQGRVCVRRSSEGCVGPDFQAPAPRQAP